MDRTIQALGHVLEVRVDQLDAVDFSHHPGTFAHRADADGAVLADFDLLLRRHGNRPAIAHDRHAVAGAQHAQGVNVQAAGAHVAFTAIGILYGNPAVALHGNVEVAAGFHQ
ncbi:hypothetical protein D3C81_1832080 [compost metagenome]